MASTSKKALQLTQELLRFDTANPPGGEEECVRFLADLVESAGFETATYEFSDGRPTLVARLRGDGDGEGKPICFAGHIDTVPLGTTEWSRDSFAGEIDGSRLYGLGVSDMKAGIAASVIAAMEMANISCRGADIVLVVTAGEETGCQGAYHVASLDGALGDAGALVVTEPTSNELAVCHKGALWLELRTRGVPAHGSMPEEGVNAIYPAAEAITTLRDFDLGYPPHPLLGPATINVGVVAGGTKINVVPDGATVQVDIRTVPGRTADETVAEIRKALGPDVEVKPVLSVDAVATDPGNVWIREVSSVIEDMSGVAPPPGGLPYFTDASVLTPAFGSVPTVILGPGEPKMAHKTDEFCLVSKIGEAADIYFELARRWCRA